MAETTQVKKKDVEPVAGDPVANTPVEKPADTKKANDAKIVAKAKKATEDVAGVEKIVKAEKAAEIKKVADAKKAESTVVLKNLFGKEVPREDYFYKGTIPSGFVGTCGSPVVREDLITVFHKVFKPSDNILFYRQDDKEVYIIIIPIKYATTIGDFNDSLDGDFQKHAISFLSEGSVNLDTLRQKLEKINKFVKYTDR